MKFLSTVGNLLASSYQKAKEVAVKAKEKTLAFLGLGTVAAGSGVLPTASNAAVTFSEATGFGGTVELLFYFSAVTVVVIALTTFWAVGKGIRLFSKG